LKGCFHLIGVHRTKVQKGPSLQLWRFRVALTPDYLPYLTKLKLSHRLSVKQQKLVPSATEGKPLHSIGLTLTVLSS
jgi:hypothetical protein